MISGLVLKERKGLRFVIRRSYKTALPSSTSFLLTVPCLAITALCDKAFQDFPFVIHSTPKVVRFAVNLHEHLIQVPLQI